MRPRPNKTLEPTRVGAFSSAFAGDASWSRVAQLCRQAKIIFTNMIVVCPLSRLPGVVATRSPERIVSLLDPGSSFPEFESVVGGRHLKLAVHDVHLPAAGEIAPAAKHIDDLLAFLALWQRTGPLVIHCRAGIGRSTAAAFIASCLYSPEVSELDVARVLRIASPTARPNESLVRIADVAMKRSGRMTEAIVETGRGLPWPAVKEGFPFEMPAVLQPNKALEPTPVGAFSSAFAVDITSPAWLSLGR
jgi:predicted protein tyrosine phosphatase